MNKLTLGLLILSMFGFTSLGKADSSFDGKWSADIPRPAPAAAQILAMTLNTKEGRVTGSILVDGAGEYPIEWGFIKGDLIVFRMKFPYFETSAMFMYIGKLDGDRIEFGRRPEDLTLGRLVQFTAKRMK